MAKLDRCVSCGGFVPFTSLACPHCKSGRTARRLKAIGATIGGGAIAFTLMACYGRPLCKDGTRDCYKDPTPTSTDDASPTTPKTVDAAPSAADAGTKK